MNNHLFRVWNFNFEKCNPAYGCSIPLGGWCEENKESPVFAAPYSDGKLIWQQFTGLKDKKGKKIYEGDIIKYIGNNDLSYRLPGVVSIGKYFTHSNEFEHYGVRVKRLDMANCYFGLSKSDSRNYLIIGNIFENPELNSI